MDGQRLNPFARLLAGSASRRQALKTLAGVLAAGSLLSGGRVARAQNEPVTDLVMANARFGVAEFPGAAFVPWRIYLTPEAAQQANVFTTEQTERLGELNWQGSFSTAAFVPSDQPDIYRTSWYCRYDLFTNSSNAGKWARARARTDAELPGAIDYSADGAELGEDFWHVQLDFPAQASSNDRTDRASVPTTWLLSNAFAAQDGSNDRIFRTSAGWRGGTIVANLTWDERGGEALRPADVRSKIERLNDEIVASVTSDPALAWMPLLPGVPQADVSVGRANRRFLPNLTTPEANRQISEQFSAGAEGYVSASAQLPEQGLALFFSCTIYPDEAAAGARVEESIERLKPGDERNKITRRAGVFPSPVPDEFSQSAWDVFVWDTGDVQVAGVELTARLGSSVYTFALIGPVDDASGTEIEKFLASARAEDLAKLVMGLVGALAQQLQSEPTVLGRYGLGTRISGLTPVDDPVRATDPAGFVNLGGALVTQPDLEALVGTIRRRARAEGTYVDIKAGGDLFEFPVLGSSLRQARLVDGTALLLGERYEGNQVIEPFVSGIGWALNPDDVGAAFDQSRQFFSPFRERSFAAPLDFAGRPWFGGVFNGPAIGPNYPRRVSAGLAPVGTTLISIVVPGEDEPLVGGGMSLMLNRLLTNTVPGDDLSRLTLFPSGSGWSLRGDHYYTHLNGVDLPGLDETDQEKAINARWNAGQTSAQKTRFTFDFGREDATGWYSGTNRNHENEDRAIEFVETYSTRYEQDFGVALTPVDVGGAIVRDRTFFFTSHQEQANGTREGRLHMVGQTKTYTSEVEFGLGVGQSATEGLDRYLRNGGGPLVEAGAAFMDNQLGILVAGKIDLHQSTVTVFDNVFVQVPPDDPGSVTVPTGFVNIAGGPPNTLDLGQLDPGARWGIVTGGYVDFSIRLNGFAFPELAAGLYDAGELDGAYLTLGRLNEARELTDWRGGAWGWTLTPDDSFDAYERKRSALAPFEERPTGTPDAFATLKIPYHGVVLDNLPIELNSSGFKKQSDVVPGAAAKRPLFAAIPDGFSLAQDFPLQVTVGLAPVGTILMGFAAAGDNEALVGQGMTLMLERLLNDEVPGDFLSRLIVLPEGPNWSWKNRFYYTRLNGEDQPILGMSAEAAAVVARRNEGQRSVLQARFEYETGRDDAAAGMDVVLRVFEEVDAAGAFVDDYPENFEADFGFPPDEVDLGERVRGSNRSRAFLTSQERADGVRDDALVVIAQVGSSVAVIRMGLLSLPSASEVRNAFLRDGGGPLVETGKAFMTEQVRVLDENEVGVHRFEVSYSL